MGGHVGQSNTSASLVLVASVTETKSLDDLHLFASGAQTDSAALITRRTNRSGLSAHCYRLKLPTLRTTLMSGWIFTIAVMTNRLV